MVAAEDDRREKVAGRRLAVDELHLPYWAELWDSALGLAHTLCADSQSLTSLNVLDLGCGQGLTGAVAAALGARVLFADIETPPLLFAALNSLPWRGRVRTRRTNWRTDDLAETFDLILGADILYERAQWPFLEPFFRRHLAAAGQILLGEPGRPAGDDFPAWIASRAWSITRTDQPVPTREKPIRIFRLTRS
jgi:predicted nicotinamide N-methyase